METEFIYVVATTWLNVMESYHDDVNIVEFTSLAAARDYHNAFLHEITKSHEYFNEDVPIDAMLYTNDPMIKYYMVDGDDSIVFNECSGCVRKLIQDCYCLT